MDDYAQAPEGDVLIHLAENNSRASVSSSGGKEYEEVNERTLFALLAKRYQRVVYASSALVYGDLEAVARHPKHPVYVNDVYTRVKRRSELAVLDGGCGIVIRLANIYGFGMAQANVISDVLRQIPAQGPIVVLNDVPVRDFLWVEDAAEGVATLATGEPKTTEPNNIFNLGTGMGTSIGAMARMALEIAGDTERKVVATKPSGRFSSLILDISDVTSVWGWKPITSLRQGLGRLLNQRYHNS